MILSEKQRSELFMQDTNSLPHIMPDIRSTTVYIIRHYIFIYDKLSMILAMKKLVIVHNYFQGKTILKRFLRHNAFFRNYVSEFLTGKCSQS